MTATTRQSGGPVTLPNSTSRQRGALAGTWTMLRFMLRRDRIRLPAWTLGLAALMVYFAVAIDGIVDDDEALESMATMASNPVMALIAGPGYGFDDLTVPRLLAGMYGLYILLGAAFMSITTLSRHTRVEEQTGRAELVRANVLGRHAQLTAALTLTLVMNLVVSVLVALAILGTGIDPQPEAGGAFLFGFSVGAVGLAFAGLAAITVQLSAFSRLGSGIAGAVLGGAFVIRGLGDMSATQDGGLDWLSWLSPLGWAQQTAPFTLDRWWPLLLAAGFAIICAAVGYTLQSRRDLAAGVLADRLGERNAPAWLRSPLALAYRLQRSGIVGWSVAMLLTGIVFGAFTEAMADGVDGMPEEVVDLMGGADGIVEGYLGFMGMFIALLVTAYAVLSIQALRGEEQGYKTEPVLAASVSRSSWLGSWTLVTAAGALWLSFLAGLSSGLGAAISTGDGDLFGPTLLGYVAQVPTAWFLLALTVALYGLAPRLTGLAWAVYLYSAFLTMFGPMMDVDEDVLNTSFFEHIGYHPAEDISWGAAALLTGLSIVLTGIGAAGFRRRDLTTA